MELIEEKWGEILEKLKFEYGIANFVFETWLEPLKIHSIKDNVITITSPLEPQMITYITNKYAVPIKMSITEFTGVNYNVEFVSEKSMETKEEKTARHLIKNQSIERANLNPRYTFDTFVVGSNNKFAHSASLAVAESPGDVYNPLFLYGGVGLGKTHLMHSIAHYVLEQNPNKKVLYVTSEAFTNELIDSIRTGTNTDLEMTKFREKYRNIDVLLIDDVQFIIGKERTQEEFFHTFNDLHGAKKQIIISSDKPPKDLETLEARLRSRFEWGLIADISSPDYETRMAILRKKEETEGYKVDDAVIEYIATNVKSNIRELEGALNKLIAYSNLEKVEITLDIAERELKDIISPDAKREITPESIIKIVAEHFSISTTDLASKKRNSEIVLPRHIAMYLCREMTDVSLSAIGTLLGKKDHTTVLNGADKISIKLQKDPTLKTTVDIIRKKINPN